MVLQKGVVTWCYIRVVTWCYIRKLLHEGIVI